MSTIGSRVTPGSVRMLMINEYPCVRAVVISASVVMKWELASATKPRSNSTYGSVALHPRMKTAIMHSIFRVGVRAQNARLRIHLVDVPLTFGMLAALELAAEARGSANLLADLQRFDKKPRFF